MGTARARRTVEECVERARSLVIVCCLLLSAFRLRGRVLVEADGLACLAIPTEFMHCPDMVIRLQASSCSTQTVRLVNMLALLIVPVRADAPRVRACAS